MQRTRLQKERTHAQNSRHRPTHRLKPFLNRNFVGAGREADAAPSLAPEATPLGVVAARGVLLGTDGAGSAAAALKARHGSIGGTTAPRAAGAVAPNRAIGATNRASIAGSVRFCASRHHERRILLPALICHRVSGNFPPSTSCTDLPNSFEFRTNVTLVELLV